MDSAESRPPGTNNPVDLFKGFESLKAERVEYCRKYSHEAPIIMSYTTARELGQLGKVLNKAIMHMMGNYEKYLSVFPRTQRELRVLDIYRAFPFSTGSFRADFVIDNQNEIKIIEMNSRQPLNGFFDTGYYSELAYQQGRRLGIEGIVEIYPAFYEYLSRFVRNVKHICVVYEASHPADRRFYPDIFRNSGIECHMIRYGELSRKTELLKNAWVISELNQREIVNLPLRLVRTLASSGCHNALSAGLTSGTKRFFSALSDPGFLADALTASEIQLVKKYIVPTYLRDNAPGEWEKARKQKDGYILKHQNKGLSVDVYAGALMTEKRWWKIITRPSGRKMVLQPFIGQRRFTGSIGEEQRNDYVTGTLLYFNDRFFGPGLYRAHTSPVSSGTGDFRKIPPLVSRSSQRLPGLTYL